MTLGLPGLALLISASSLSSGLGVWFIASRLQPPAAPVCRCEAPAPVAVSPPPPVPVPVAPPPPRGSCRGMTWSLLKQEKNIVRVGSDPAHTNAYLGDTDCETELSILCLLPKNLPKPEGLASDFYSGWSGAEIAATTPIAGRLLTSRAEADARCAKALGAGWRMAEHHDGRGGWGLTGVGEVSRDARFWVAINDQPANPWNSR